MTRARLVGTGLWVVVVLLVVIGIGAVAGRLADPYRGVGPPGTSPGTEIGYVEHPSLTLAHIIPGAVFMVLGPLQFIGSLRRRYLGWHRWAGRAFIAASAIIGVTALMMGIIMPIGGVNETAATTVFAMLFLFTVGRAFVYIRRRDISHHREWMLRAFAIGLAIATIRPITAFFFVLTSLTPQQFFGTAFWIGFGVHVLIAEIWIRQTRRPGWSGVPGRLVLDDAAR
jgi:hypothetical protein